jgi:tetratricopeptide (TPR) repeat protein
MTVMTLIAMLGALALQDAPTADVAVAPQTEFRTPQQRLSERLDALAAAETPRDAAPLIDEIHALWSHSGSDTIALLMDRGAAAEAAGNDDIAARMYDHVTQLQPDFAEGWLAAGRVAAGFEDWAYALETLNTALTLEPRRYDAYLTLGRVLERAEAWEAALDAYEAALAIYPAHEAARSARDRLNDALAGRAL